MADRFIQRVIIPKGLVNPNETTIVEIPGAYKNAQAVVAKPKTGGGIKNLSQFSYGSSGSSACSPCSPPRGGAKKRSMRKTHPELGEKVGGFDISDIDFAGFTWSAGQGNQGSADESSHGFHPYVPKEPYSPDVSYRQFVPPAQSTMGDLSYEEGSLYRDFRPKTTGTPTVRANSPGQSPPSMDKYQSGPQSRVGRKTGVSGESSGEYTQESYGEGGQSSSGGGYCPAGISGESSGRGAIQSSGPGSSGGYGGYSSSGGGYCPAGAYGVSSQRGAMESSGTSSSGGYGGYLSSGGGYYPAGAYSESSSSGGMIYAGCPSPGSSANSRVDSISPPGGAVTQADLMNSLGQIEASEMQKIMSDLNNYQSARRRLLFDASSLASAADVSSTILSSSGSSS